VAPLLSHMGVDMCRRPVPAAGACHRKPRGAGSDVHAGWRTLGAFVPSRRVRR